MKIKFNGEKSRKISQALPFHVRRVRCSQCVQPVTGAPGRGVGAERNALGKAKVCEILLDSSPERPPADAERRAQRGRCKRTKQDNEHGVAPREIGSAWWGDGSVPAEASLRGRNTLPPVSPEKVPALSRGAAPTQCGHQVALPAEQPRAGPSQPRGSQGLRAGAARSVPTWQPPPPLHQGPGACEMRIPGPRSRTARLLV